jgi:transcriptional regulator with XRE-family HTH domain
MSSFAERLRSEIDFAGLSQKEFAAKASIKKRALDMYLGAQQSMPPADVAVKLAAALGVSVEYLVTGKEYRHSVDISQFINQRDFLEDMAALPIDLAQLIKAMVKSAAGRERRKHR